MERERGREVSKETFRLCLLSAVQTVHHTALLCHRVYVCVCVRVCTCVCVCGVLLYTLGRGSHAICQQSCRALFTLSTYLVTGDFCWSGSTHTIHRQGHVATLCERSHIRVRGHFDAVRKTNASHCIYCTHTILKKKKKRKRGARERCLFRMVALRLCLEQVLEQKCYPSPLLWAGGVLQAKCSAGQEHFWIR